MGNIKTKNSIFKLIDSGELIIRPLLDNNQVNEVGIDFRLGLNFLISTQGRNPIMIASLNKEFGENIDSKQFFQETRRQLGETVTLYPHQTVLATSLEYLKIPNNILLTLYMRSSYSRMGLSVSTITQPGYCGCLSLELTNLNNIPINVTTGARLFQATLSEVDEPTDYFSSNRKYLCNVRPQPSIVVSDTDLDLLNNLWLKNNHRT